MVALLALDKLRAVGCYSGKDREAALHAQHGAMPTVYRPFFKGKTVPHCRRGRFCPEFGGEQRCTPQKAVHSAGHREEEMPSWNGHSIV